MSKTTTEAAAVLAVVEYARGIAGPGSRLRTLLDTLDGWTPEAPALDAATADVALHLGAAKRAARALLALPPEKGTLPEIDRLIDETDALTEALYQLAERLDPCAAVAPRAMVGHGHMCQLRKHAPERNHKATVDGVTYSWSAQPLPDTRPRGGE